MRRVYVCVAGSRWRGGRVTKEATLSVTSGKYAHDVADSSSFEQCSTCLLWPNSVCMCVCLYVWEICNATVRNKNKTGRCFRMARHQARRRLWWKKKINQAKLESKVHTKGRTNVFRFSVFCRLKGKKKFSFSLFSRGRSFSKESNTFFMWLVQAA